jgi:membrane-associated HD superfamily phosphohydrolase
MKTLRERERERERGEERVEKQGSETNNKTRVFIVFLLATNTSVGIESQMIHLGETLLELSLLVTGRDSGLLIELGLKTNSCNPFLISLVKLLIIIVERKAALSPRVCQYWTELGNQIYVCSLSLSLFYLLLVFITVTHIVFVA